MKQTFNSLQFQKEIYPKLSELVQFVRKHQQKVCCFYTPKEIVAELVRSLKNGGLFVDYVDGKINGILMAHYYLDTWHIAQIIIEKQPRRVIREWVRRAMEAHGLEASDIVTAIRHRHKRSFTMNDFNRFAERI